MSRVRFMSPYLKDGRDTGKLVNRARYIATRPGVEVLRDVYKRQSSMTAPTPPLASTLRITRGMY